MLGRARLSSGRQSQIRCACGRASQPRDRRLSSLRWVPTPVHHAQEREYRSWTHRVAVSCARWRFSRRLRRYRSPCQAKPPKRIRARSMPPDVTAIVVTIPTIVMPVTSGAAHIGALWVGAGASVTSDHAMAGIVARGGVGGRTAGDKRKRYSARIFFSAAEQTCQHSIRSRSTTPADRGGRRWRDALPFERAPGPVGRHRLSWHPKVRRCRGNRLAWRGKRRSGQCAGNHRSKGLAEILDS